MPPSGTRRRRLPRDRKELLRALLEEVIIKVKRDKAAAHLTLRWKGGALIEIDLASAALAAGHDSHRRGHDRTRPPAGGPLPRHRDRRHPQSPGAQTTAYGHRFEASRVGNLRRHWDIPCFEAGPSSTKGELASIKKAAVVLGVAPSTLHRWLNDGIIPGRAADARRTLAHSPDR